MLGLLSSTVLIIGFSLLAQACQHNSICSKSRDTIVQSNTGILASERLRNSSRIWYISPRTESFNAILAFKNFSSEHSAVIVIAYDSEGETTTRHLLGNLGNFEVVLQNVMAVIVYVPINIHRSADFTLNYYIGCSVLTAAHDEINHRLINANNGDDANCWLIHPRDSDHRKRIYLSIRDVKLSQTEKINIWDLHTSNTIKETRQEDYDFVAAESHEGRYQQSIMVDFESNSVNQRPNKFSIAYYTMTQNDSSCIEKQKACFASNKANKNCSFECPALNKMILEEYGGKLNQLIPIQKSSRKSSKCILPQQYCNCPKSIPKQYFCHKQIKCLRMGRCTFACIYHKLTTCLRIKVLSSVTLL